MNVVTTVEMITSRAFRMVVLGKRRFVACKFESGDDARENAENRSIQSRILAVRIAPVQAYDIPASRPDG